MSSQGEKEKMSTRPDNIDDLLDSALQDFDNVSKVSKAKPSKSKGEAVEKELLDLLGKVGISEGGDLSAVNEELLKLSQLAADGCPPTAAGEATLQDALRQLSADSEKLKDIPSEEELNRMFEGLDGAGKLEDGLGNLLPMMEGMMQSLLSKDLLYPAMKDMNDKYPGWLADNRGNLSDEDYTKYNKQYDLTRRVCHEYAKEDEQSSEADKKATFERVMALMQEMQELGHPPKEIVGDGNGGGGLPLGGAGFPGAEQCVIS